MHSTATSAAVAAGKWSTTAKTVAMGAAGTALWGSLAFYFVVGVNGADPIVSENTAKNLFFRMELAETDLVEGCKLNSDAGLCDGTAWIILTGHRPRAETPDMPSALADTIPAPLWEQVAARNELSDGACGAAIAHDLPAWLASVQKPTAGVVVARLPDSLASCQASTAGVGPQHDHRNFWFFEGDKVVAELRCTMPGTYMDPSCELAAYPEHGTYEVSFSRLPAINVEEIVYQAPQMLAILDANLPSEAKGIVDLDVIKAPFVQAPETGQAMVELGGVSG